MLSRFKGLFTKQIPLTGLSITSGKELFLWPDASNKSGEEQVRIAEGLQVISNIHNPSIIAYLPSAENNTGAAVIIAPGGSHKELWIDHEGHHPGQWLSDQGVAAFVLKYRLAMEPDSTYTVEEHALPDIQRAIRVVRNNASEWGIKGDRIGVMGFSAGGQLAGLAAIHHDRGNNNRKNDDPIDRENSYPDFQALIYPWKIKNFSMAKKAPPLFLLGGFHDDLEISEDMTELYLKYKKAGVPAELHIYSAPGHGFGMRENNQGAIAGWPSRLLEWLDDIGFLKK